MPHWYKDRTGKWKYSKPIGSHKGRRGVGTHKVTQDDRGKAPKRTSNDRFVKGPKLSDEQQAELKQFKTRGIDRTRKEGETSREAFERIQGEKKEAGSRVKRLLKSQLGKDWREKLPSVAKEDRGRVRNLRSKQTRAQATSYALKNRLSDIDKKLLEATDADERARLLEQQAKATEKRTSTTEKLSNIKERKEKLTNDRAEARSRLTEKAYAKSQRPVGSHSGTRGIGTSTVTEDNRSTFEPPQNSRMYQNVKRRMKKRNKTSTVTGR